MNNIHQNTKRHAVPVATALCLAVAALGAGMANAASLGFEPGSHDLSISGQVRLAGATASWHYNAEPVRAGAIEFVPGTMSYEVDLTDANGTPTDPGSNGTLGILGAYVTADGGVSTMVGPTAIATTGGRLTQMRLLGAESATIGDTKVGSGAAVRLPLRGNPDGAGVRNLGSADVTVLYDAFVAQTRRTAKGYAPMPYSKTSPTGSWCGLHTAADSTATGMGLSVLTTGPGGGQVSVPHSTATGLAAIGSGGFTTLTRAERLKGAAYRLAGTDGSGGSSSFGGALTGLSSEAEAEGAGLCGGILQGAWADQGAGGAMVLAEAAPTNTVAVAERLGEWQAWTDSLVPASNPALGLRDLSDATASTWDGFRPTSPSSTPGVYSAVYVATGIASKATLNFTTAPTATTSWTIPLHFEITYN